MTKLQKTVGKYPIVHDGMMVPDCILDILQAVTAPIVQPVFEKHLLLDKTGDLVPPLNKHRLEIPLPIIKWDQSCTLVTEAFYRFDPDLGTRVTHILADPACIHLTKVATGEAGGSCGPAGWKDLKRAEIYYDYEESINDAVYIAHELGHFLASDFAIESGYKQENIWMPKHVAEIPAMFTHCIMYDYLINGQENPVLQKAGRQHVAGEFTRSLYELQVSYANPIDKDIPQDEYEQKIASALGKNWRSFSKAEKRLYTTRCLHEHDTASVIAMGLYSSGFDRNSAVFDAMFKRGKDSHILDVLQAADVTTEEDLHKLLSMAVTEIVKPLEIIYADYIRLEK